RSCDLPGYHQEPAGRPGSFVAGYLIEAAAGFKRQSARKCSLARGLRLQACKKEDFLNVAEI
ncbi:hypothetical protein, partial [Pseudomonas sp.]|uniref:hypothetical protein n=1 Tax=Pseudomonas sp. TaxID=306 RepID=UPI003267DC60